MPALLSAALWSDQLADLLVHAGRAVVLTGAGISTASGIPDFRSAQSGLWAHCDPEQVASLHGFRRDPQPFFTWFYPLWQAIAQAAPSIGHRALAAWEARGLVAHLITQNVDSLHTRAGSQAVAELHGHARAMTCVHCFREYPLVFAEGVSAVPRCPSCGGVLKPNVILFGEELPHRALLQAQRAAVQADVFIAIGSSLEVHPASALPLLARRAGASVWLLNRTATPLDAIADGICRDDIDQVLPALSKRLECDPG
jgi:NAD-dependent deacetylase